MTRLIEEKAQLEERAEKLGGFIMSEGFSKIDSHQKPILMVQHYAMRTYLACLNERINLLSPQSDK